ncbi:uncharacterized protein PSFLO_02341 [Pseudozyma flocculosa]|uniref:Uncharacterized protein n=1 Tax=Pseudozyma flocculosa TaxID=84751 RepID=A0A5C3EYC4_9BASI|nr:uncharacterized protein PSFLO_02341 [Pseudozyma flocculosa]
MTPGGAECDRRRRLGRSLYQTSFDVEIILVSSHADPDCLHLAIVDGCEKGNVAPTSLLRRDPHFLLQKCTVPFARLKSLFRPRLTAGTAGVRRPQVARVVIPEAFAYRERHDCSQALLCPRDLVLLDLLSIHVEAVPVLCKRAALRRDIERRDWAFQRTGRSNPLLGSPTTPGMPLTNFV